MSARVSRSASPSREPRWRVTHWCTPRRAGRGPGRADGHRRRRDDHGRAARRARDAAARGPASGPTTCWSRSSSTRCSSGRTRTSTATRAPSTPTWRSAARAGADLVFAPAVAEMYPDGEPRVRVDPGPLGEELEGASRPGFFHGVLTVVIKLLQLTRPDLAFFGEKDYQQLTLIRRMVRDLDLPVEVVGVPTVREPDGLALSSRNRYLSPAERAAALSLSAALRAGRGPPTAAGRGRGARRRAAAFDAVRPAPASTTWCSPTRSWAGAGRRAGPAADRRLGRRHPADRQRGDPPRPASLTRPPPHIRKAPRCSAPCSSRRSTGPR